MNSRFNHRFPNLPIIPILSPLSLLRTWQGYPPQTRYVLNPGPYMVFPQGCGGTRDPWMPKLQNTIIGRACAQVEAPDGWHHMYQVLWDPEMTTSHRANISQKFVYWLWKFTSDAMGVFCTLRRCCMDAGDRRGGGRGQWGMGGGADANKSRSWFWKWAQKHILETWRPSLIIFV